MANTDPLHWFLDDADTVLQPSFTKKNKILPLIDGKSYFQQLFTRISDLLIDGYIHISGWRLTPITKLVPELNNLTIEEILINKINEGIRVRSMLWNVPLTIGNISVSHGTENLEITTKINNARRVGAETPFAILDDRIAPGKFGSHHQKFIVLGDSRKNHAFLGGIDIAFDRWDTPEHKQPVVRQRELFDGWHDVQCEVEGLAVK